LGQRYQEDIPLEQAAAEFSREFATGSGRKRLDAEAKKAQRGDKKKGPTSLTIAVFGSGSASADQTLLAEAERLGTLIGQAGYDLICGGYGGTMAAASKGVSQAGGQAIGVTMALFDHLEPNPWLTKERKVKDFFPRLKRLTGADAFIVLKGGIGTLTEATLTWSLLQTGQIAPRPFVFVGEHWHRLFETFREYTFMNDRDFELVTVVPNVDEAIVALKDSLSPTP
jgi:uncharacterized protein (TIGR00730 family)